MESGSAAAGPDFMMYKSDITGYKQLYFWEYFGNISVREMIVQKVQIYRNEYTINNILSKVIVNLKIFSKYS